MQTFGTWLENFPVESEPVGIPTQSSAGMDVMQLPDGFYWVSYFKTDFHTKIRQHTTWNIAKITTFNKTGHKSDGTRFLTFWGDQRGAILQMFKKAKFIPIPEPK